MDYVPLGRTGLLVSRLALGAMTFGEGKGPLQRLDLEAATELVNVSLDAGINFFNTAATYGGGRSEEILGAALKPHRDDVIIATKVSGNTAKSPALRRLSRRHVLASVEASLRRLDTDYIDVYLAHHFDPVTPLEETLEAFDTVVRQGKVRYLGFSSWPAWAAAEARGLQRLNGWHTFCASESYYSLLGRDLEHELVPYCQHAGIGILAWSPLAMGFLAGRYRRGDISSQQGRFTSYDVVPPFNLEHGHDVLDVVREIADAHSATPAQISLAWVLTHDAITSILVGASSRNQLVDNLGAVDVALTDEEVQRLNDITEPSPIYPGWIQKAVANRRMRLKDPTDAGGRNRSRPIQVP
ncbi:aldo/keto reductase [Mycolicibacterium setense]|uniref:aldo/keto reductase n=1 Tax=Mycolicibacterium setense TaxID=431269 RepID=UPI0007EAC44D|nr:aldo/keto reductase [Mycolicibacterium setense]OBB14631.1 aldo/keto reductase [Mycolicibacterium setense]